MKKISTYSLISSLTLILISAASLYALKNIDNIEIRVKWLTPTLYQILFISLFFFFLSIAIKVLKSKREKRIKISIAVLYSAIIFLIINLKLSFIIQVISLILGLIVLIILFLKKKVGWQRYFLSTSSGILGIISLVMLTTSFYIKDDFVRKDKYVKYKSLNNNLKIIVQTENFDIRYIISHDYGIFRKRERFKYILPDGKWQKFNEGQENIALLTVKNKEIINKDIVLPENTHIVNDRFEIQNLIENKNPTDTITILFKNSFELTGSIYIRDKANIIFKLIPYGESPTITSRGNAVFNIINSKNITIQDIELHAVSSNNVISIYNSENITVTRSTIKGGVLESVVVDEKSKNITFSNNNFKDFKNHSVVGYSFNTMITDNWYYKNEKEESCWSILLLDKEFNTDFQNRMIENTLLAYNGYTGSYYDTVMLFGKEYPKYEEGTLDDYFDMYRIPSFLRNYANDSISQEFDYDYYYCDDFISYLMQQPLFKNYREGELDSWCWDDKGEPKFQFANPDFFKALRDKVYLDPNYSIKGVLFKTIYKKLFSNLFRNYYSSYLLLHNDEGIYNKGIDYKVECYKAFVDSEYWDVYTFVFHGYVEPNDIDFSLDYYSEQPEELGVFYQESRIDLGDSKVIINEREINASLMTKLISFWIRREIDGSANEIFLTLEHYLKDFDKEWLESEKNYYRGIYR